MTPRLCSGLVALALTLPAGAHTRSESLSVWLVQGAAVSATVSVPEAEAMRLSADGRSPPADAALASYLASHLGAGAQGQPCAPAAAPLVAAAAKGFRRVELRWRCPQGGQLTIRSDAFYEMVPTHLMYARVRELGLAAGGAGASERFSEQLLNTEHRSLNVGGGDSGAQALVSAGWLDYIALGLQHIVTGPDHIAFLLGLVLISARFKDLALVVTGFTIGHSATLALAVTGWLRPQPALIDVLIALTIGLIGAETLAHALGRRVRWLALAAAGALLAMAGLRLAGVGALPLALLLGLALFAPCYLLLAARLNAGNATTPGRGARLRAGVTAVFGLVHGFAFANDLIEMQLPAGRLAELLLGFNLGVEAGQLLIVVLLLGSALLLQRLLPRWRQWLPRQLVAEMIASALVGLSVFWIVVRSYA